MIYGWRPFFPPSKKKKKRVISEREKVGQGNMEAAGERQRVQTNVAESRRQSCLVRGFLDIIGALVEVCITKNSRSLIYALYE